MQYMFGKRNIPGAAAATVVEGRQEMSVSAVDWPLGAAGLCCSTRRGPNRRELAVCGPGSGWRTAGATDTTLAVFVTAVGVDTMA